MNSGWVLAFIALSTTVVGMGAWAMRWAWKIAQRATRFLDDYFGEPARDGAEAKPGVMTRLAKVETMVTSISREVHLNSGHSMRDVVQKTDAAVTQVQTNVTQVQAQVKELAHRVEQINDQRGGR